MKQDLLGLDAGTSRASPRPVMSPQKFFLKVHKFTVPKWVYKVYNIYVDTPPNF